MSDMHGKVYWTELMTRDVKAAVDYYTALCGWTVDEMPMGEGTTYWVCSREGVPTAGIMDMSGSEEMADLPPHWFSYLAVDDLDAAIALTEASGGKLTRPVFEVPDTGHIALVIDPTGAPIGIMKPAPMPEA